MKANPKHRRICRRKGCQNSVTFQNKNGCCALHPALTLNPKVSNKERRAKAVARELKAAETRRRNALAVLSAGSLDVFFAHLKRDFPYEVAIREARSHEKFLLGRQGAEA